MKSKIDPTEYIFSVSEFVEAIRVILQDKVGEIKVQGEVTDFRPRHGNLIFFELKDKNSRLQCFMMNWELKVPLEDGMEVMVSGTPSLFKRSGKFHIKVSEVQPIGEGALARALELLKKKLDKEGLFAEERKRHLPQLPQKIGIITSPDAAAYTDILRILKNRWSGLDILLYPVSVQGAGSERQIQEAFDYFNQTRSAEVIVLTRGGGSLEDLQSFNSEEVARAVFASLIPVVCGVGHERDVTIADLVADQRASTPSNAAERIVPDKKEVLFQIEAYQKTIAQETGLLIENLSNKINEQINSLNKEMQKNKENFYQLKSRFSHTLVSFKEKLGFKKEYLLSTTNNLYQILTNRINQLAQKQKSSQKILQSLSPSQTLSRGYSIVYDSAGKIIKSAVDLKKNQVITTQFNKGKANSKIIKTSKN